MAFVYLGAFLNFWDSFFARGALLEFCAFPLTFRLLFAFGRSDFFTVFALLDFCAFACCTVTLLGCCAVGARLGFCAFRTPLNFCFFFFLFCIFALSGSFALLGLFCAFSVHLHFLDAFALLGLFRTFELLLFCTVWVLLHLSFGSYLEF